MSHYERTTYPQPYVRNDPVLPAFTRPSLAEMEWTEEAECAGEDTELFYRQDYEPRDSKLSKYRERAAKTICRECKVKTQCLQNAIETEDHYAIRGGLTPKERWQLTGVPAAINFKTFRG